MQYRKDLTPSETIRSIRKILKENNLSVIERNLSFDGVFFSSRLEFKFFPGIGVNGKGITKQAALASAYAEFMERLQARFLIKPYFFNKITKIKSFEDEFLLQGTSFEKLCTKIFNFVHPKKVIHFLKEIDYEKNHYNYCLNFIDYFRKKEVQLPLKLINILTHSNGLCAGNTFEEAVSHGVCEIFERFIYKKIMMEKYNPPTLKIKKLESLSSFSLLKKVEDMGYSYIIKDCSLEGTLPVVGVLIYDKNTNRSVFSVGSDIDFDIALQRCLTEIFQGLNNKQDIAGKLKPFLREKDNLYTNWLFSYVANLGAPPKELFNSKKIIFDIPKCFCAVHTNAEALQKILEIVKKYKKTLYIKDLAFLGFPTYRLYIPSLSEIEDFDHIYVPALKYRQLLFSTFFDIENSSTASIKMCIKILNKMKDRSFYKELNLPSSYFSLRGFLNSSLLNADYNVIIQILKEKLDNTKLSKKFVLPKCPNCNSCNISCCFKKWIAYDHLLQNKYIGYLIHHNKFDNKLTNIKIEELRPEMTQCRIIQIEKHLGEK